LALAFEQLQQKSTPVQELEQKNNSAVNSGPI